MINKNFIKELETQRENVKIAISENTKRLKQELKLIDELIRVHFNADNNEKLLRSQGFERRNTGLNHRLQVVPDLVSIASNESRIEKLGLSLRTQNALKRGGVHSIESLGVRSKEEIMGFRHFGITMYREVVKALDVYNRSIAQGA